MTIEPWEVGAAILASMAAGMWILFLRRVRVRVRPVRLEARGSRVPMGLGIEVRNVGRRPVTIREVGYVLPGRHRVPICPAITLLDGELPARLKPGAQLTVRGGLLEADLKVLRLAQRAYAITSGGRHATGTSPEFCQVVAFAGTLFQGDPGTPWPAAG